MDSKVNETESGRRCEKQRIILLSNAMPLDSPVMNFGVIDRADHCTDRFARTVLEVIRCQNCLVVTAKHVQRSGTHSSERFVDLKQMLIDNDRQEQSSA